MSFSTPNLDTTENEEEEFSSPHEVYKRLIEVVINETLAPELLPFEEAVVDCIVDQIQHMTDNIKRLGARLGSFCIEQHRIELERFSSVVTKYYRTRIGKIESNAASLVRILERQERPRSDKPLMSKQEVEYLKSFVVSIDEHLEQNVLRHMPPNMQKFKLSEVAANRQEFNVNYVFVKAVKKTTVQVDDPLTGQETVEMDKNSQHFLPYSAVRPHLQSSSKDLTLM